MMKSLISGTALSLVLTALVFAADLPGNKPPVYVPPPRRRRCGPASTPV